MFIQCKGPEARTAASISISRQREALNSTDEEPDSTSSSGSSRSTTDNSSSGCSGGYSYFNAAEAAVVVDTLQQLLGAGMQPEDLCVITPYRCMLLAGQAVSNSAQQPAQQLSIVWADIEHWTAATGYGFWSPSQISIQMV
jgi:hypothetical protein